MESLIQKQIEQLENNYYAVKQVELQHETYKTSPFYSLFRTENEREKALQKNVRLHQRLLRMRMGILLKIGKSSLAESNKLNNVPSIVNN